MIKQIENIINEWDPLDLFPLAPLDEYSIEIKKIVNYLENIKEYSVGELAEKIHEIFTEMFGQENFTKSLSECTEISKKILS